MNVELIKLNFGFAIQCAAARCNEASLMRHICSTIVGMYTFVCYPACLITFFFPQKKTWTFAIWTWISAILAVSIYTYSSSSSSCSVPFYKSYKGSYNTVIHSFIHSFIHFIVESVAAAGWHIFAIFHFAGPAKLRSGLIKSVLTGNLSGQVSF